MAEQTGNQPDIHLPSPSYWPLVMSIGITFLLLGLIFSYYLSGIGFLIFAASLIGWLREPTGMEGEH